MGPFISKNGSATCVCGRCQPSVVLDPYYQYRSIRTLRQPPFSSRGVKGRPCHPCFPIAASLAATSLSKRPHEKGVPGRIPDYLQSPGGVALFGHIPAGPATPCLRLDGGTGYPQEDTEVSYSGTVCPLLTSLGVGQPRLFKPYTALPVTLRLRLFRRAHIP